jgi:hypothetical protein
MTEAEMVGRDGRRCLYLVRTRWEARNEPGNVSVGGDAQICDSARTAQQEI